MESKDISLNIVNKIELFLNDSFMFYYSMNDCWDDICMDAQINNENIAKDSI